MRVLALRRRQLDMFDDEDDVDAGETGDAGPVAEDPDDDSEIVSQVASITDSDKKKELVLEALSMYTKHLLGE